MNFVSVKIVPQTVDQVWNFLADPLNSPMWDRSVAQVILQPGGFTGLGCVVETVSPSGMHQSFTVTAFQPPEFLKFELLKSSMFKWAELVFKIEKVEEGTKITHQINFKLHFYQFYLSLILLLTNKKALGRDFECLREALTKI